MAECFFVDVGHGNASLFIDGTACAIVDCAPAKALMDLVRSRGLFAIDALFISHADHDHIGGAVALLSADDLTIGTVFVAPDPIKPSAAWLDFRVALRDARKRSGVRVVTAINAATPGTVQVGGLRVEICFPTELEALGGPGSFLEGHKLTGNDMSAVVRVLFNCDAVALCAADATPWSLCRLADLGLDVRAPIVVFPHHGSAMAPVDSAEIFLDAVGPRFAVFSHARKLFRNPRPEMVELVRRHGARPMCTQLSMHCAPADDAVGRAPEYPSAGLARRRCCVGTSRFDLPIVDFSASGEHATFVSLLPSPMCVGETTR